MQKAPAKMLRLFQNEAWWWSIALRQTLIPNDSGCGSKLSGHWHKKVQNNADLPFTNQLGLLQRRGLHRSIFDGIDYFIHLGL